MEFNFSDLEVENEYDLIEFWRENLPENESVRIPRNIIGMPTDYVLGFPDEAVIFDSIIISRQHLEQMTNQEVIQFINSQSHTIH